MKKARIAILGFGLTGRLAALGLQQKYDVTVFEKGSLEAQKSAGFVAAAMLAPLAESVLCDEDIAKQGLAAIARWQTIIESLTLPVFFQQQGSLILAHQQDRGDLMSFRQRLKPLSGFLPVDVTTAKINELEPELGQRFHQGIYLPCEGQLDNRQFYQASLHQLQQSDVTLIEHYQDQINHDEFDLVLDCRGMGAKTSLNNLRGVRGEVVRLYAPEVTLNRPVRLMHPRYPIYVVPKPNHEFVIGATEIESQSNKPMTLRSAMELLSAAYTLHTGFAEAEILEINAGLRPSLNDNRPMVEQSGKVIQINGLYRHGYLLAPIVVDQAIALVEKACEKEYETHY